MLQLEIQNRRQRLHSTPLLRKALREPIQCRTRDGIVSKVSKMRFFALYLDHSSKVFQFVPLISIFQTPCAAVVFFMQHQHLPVSPSPPRSRPSRGIGGTTSSHPTAEDRDGDDRGVKFRARTASFGQQPHQIAKHKSKTGFVGLKNMGCICYMNSTLQQVKWFFLRVFGLLCVS